MLWEAGGARGGDSTTPGPPLWPQGPEGRGQGNGRRPVPLSVSRGPSWLFPVVAVPLCIPSPPAAQDTFLHTHSLFCLGDAPQQVRGDPSLLLFCGSRMAGDAKHLFCWPFLFLFGRTSVQILSPFLNWYFFIYTFNLMSPLHVGY